MHTKRLFLAIEVDAPWPSHFPEGRAIDPSSRHMTLAFLGNVNPEPLLSQIDQMPKPPFELAPVGYTDEILFLPKNHKRVVALHVNWFGKKQAIASYQKQVLDFLENLGYSVDRRPFLSHVSLARAPFDEEKWKESFTPLPTIAKSINLYESVGNLRYPSLWRYNLVAPFEEKEHTADIAFLIKGNQISDLYLHAAIALAFDHPPMLSKIKPEKDITHLDQVIQALNNLIFEVDSQYGCPFKAISYHGKVREEKNGLLSWEMIVDV